MIVRIRALVDSVNSSGTYTSGGTARVDNLMINGTAVPAPGALALLGVAGLVGSRRRR
jgi:MYXO-CTERM domain-containing protein